VQQLLPTPDGQAAVWAVLFKRFAEPTELEGPLPLLASNASSYITGSVLTARRVTFSRTPPAEASSSFNTRLSSSDPFVATGHAVASIRFSFLLASLLPSRRRRRPEEANEGLEARICQPQMRDHHLRWAAVEERV
jgi:hypothetical protein